MTQPLNVVVVGAGYFSQFHQDAWKRLPGANLVAAVEPDDSNREKLMVSFPGTRWLSSIEQALDGPKVDIVDIVTPPVTHESLIKSIFSVTSSETLVICQKPFCTSMDQATHLAEFAQERQRKLVIHENFRFQPWYSQIKTMLDEQELGDVLQATFWMRTGDGRGSQAYLDRQPYFQKMPRFLIHETGIHWIDTFRFLFGEPDALYADLRRINPHISGEDAGILLFNYQNGLRVILDGNRHLDHAARNKRFTLGEMSIEGTTATLRLKGDGGLTIRKFNEIEEHTVNYQFNDKGFAGDCVYRLNQHVRDHLSTGGVLHNQAIEYLRNLQLEELIYESAATGKRLEC